MFVKWAGLKTAVSTAGNAKRRLLGVTDTTKPAKVCLAATSVLRPQCDNRQIIHRKWLNLAATGVGYLSSGDVFLLTPS